MPRGVCQRKEGAIEGYARPNAIEIESTGAAVSLAIVIKGSAIVYQSLTSLRCLHRYAAAAEAASLKTIKRDKGGRHNNGRIDVQSSFKCHFEVSRRLSAKWLRRNGGSAVKCLFVLTKRECEKC